MAFGGSLGLVIPTSVLYIHIIGQSQMNCLQCAAHLPRYRRRNSLLRHGADVRHDHLVDEAAEAEPEVGGQLPHLHRQQVPQLGQLVLVVLHRLAEVHQVVEVDGVVGRQRETQPQVQRLVDSQRQPDPLRSDLDGLLLVDGPAQLLVALPPSPGWPRF